ncbi:MAG TPA: hypothetical protein PLI66_04865, partial [Spirochaetales bacterium]|nr:hypothetical protein [Spirochaetales bacterium]
RRPAAGRAAPGRGRNGRNKPGPAQARDNRGGDGAMPPAGRNKRRRAGRNGNAERRGPDGLRDGMPPAGAHAASASTPVPINAPRVRSRIKPSTRETIVSADSLPLSRTRRPVASDSSLMTAL